LGSLIGVLITRPAFAEIIKKFVWYFILFFF
jgi:hypothetical protein